MNNVKRVTIFTRLRDAFNAFRGREIGSIQYGLVITRCDQCEYKKKSEENAE